MDGTKNHAGRIRAKQKSALAPTFYCAAPDATSPVAIALQEAARCALDSCALGTLSKVQRYQMEAISAQLVQHAVSVFLTVLADHSDPTIDLAGGTTIYAGAFPELALAVERIDIENLAEG